MKLWPKKPQLAVTMLALLCCMSNIHAQAESPAVLKLQVRLDSGVIKVSDLWVGAGAKGDTVIGAAPPPGRSFAIEAEQLAYIARLYEVEWRPVSGVERTSVERAGRPLTREEMAAPVQRSLVEGGAAATTSVEFTNFEPIEVPPSSFPLLSVEGISYDQASERFSANIAASTAGMETQHVRVSGRVVQMVTAVVALRRLQPGDVIGPADVQTAQVAQRRLTGPVISEIAQTIGQSPKRTVVAGQPLSTSDIGPPVMVVKGDTVVIMLDTPNMSLAVQGVAMSQGGRDDIIQVMNPLSRAIVAARVAGPGRAVIAPGSVPLVAPRGTPSRSPEVTN